MLRRYLWALKLVCLLLFALIAAQAFSLVKERDPLEGLSGTAFEAPALAQTKDKAPGPGKEETKLATAPLPDGYKVIEQSGILGRAPDRPPPVLLGIVGKYALIQTPGGNSGMVVEGGELDGIKVLRIATNRALIEHQGKQQELVIFSGIGSSSLLPPTQEKQP